MKYDDIEIGQDYAIGTQSFNSRGTAVEKATDKQVEIFEDWHRRMSKPGKRILVRFDRTQKWVTPTQVIRSWAEQEDLNRQAKEAAKAKQDRRERLAEALGAPVAKHYFARGHLDETQVVVSIDALERALGIGEVAS